MTRSDGDIHSPANVPVSLQMGGNVRGARAGRGRGGGGGGEGRRGWGMGGEGKH